MKQYFTQLLQYDYETNLTMLNLIASSDSPAEAVRLMSHLLGAQQVWLGRCQQDPNAPGGAIWPSDWQLDHLFELNKTNHQAWLEFINGQEDFDQIVSYKNSKGDAFADKLSDILAHLINHGTHHRAQIGQELKMAGVENLPSTDLIFYIRSKQK